MSDKVMAEVLGRAFVAVRSGDHLTDIHKQHIDFAVRENTTLDVDFTISELNIALLGTGYTFPGQDQLCLALTVASRII